jgi:chromosome segregation ATPase
LEELKRLSEDLTKQKEKLRELQDKELNFSNMEKEVREYETLFLAFHAMLEQLRDLNSALERQTNDLNTRKKEYNGHLNESTERQKELDGLKPGYEKREDLFKLRRGAQKDCTGNGSRRDYKKNH